MPIAKITGQGLSAIALSVALLWGFCAEERLLVRRASEERARVLRELKRLQHSTPPSAAPFRLSRSAPRVNAG
jgi:histidinol-phosphate/aromatic aminotransferase/cobyric acid decarboxylase-like protein